MKKSFMIATAVAVLFSLSAAAAYEEEYYSYSYARLSYVKGDVYVQRAGDLAFEEGTVNLAIVEGDKLGTRLGRAEVHFGRKNYLRVDDATQIDFINLPRKGEDWVKLHLLTGNIYLSLNFLESEKSYEVHTPDASFYILEQGLYRWNVREGGETELLVLEGSAEAAGEGGSVLINSRERLHASNGNLSSHSSLSYAGEDDFARWNASREDLGRQYVSQRYLPSELEDYEGELARNGRWEYERPYGYVWVPNVSYADWRPYYFGRWVWYPIIGWTWVSSEPWGWCTYHYGRWHWRIGLGWHWIPTRYWGPAWVHWYRGYDYIGWCPLSYYNYPVVIVNNRFYDRYYNRYHMISSRALTVVHKEQLQSRQISHVALSHVQATSLGRISLTAASSREIAHNPSLNSLNARNAEAARVLSRSQLRPVGKSYGASQGRASSLRSSSAPNQGSLRIQRSPSSLRNSEAPRLRTSSEASRISSRPSAVSGVRSSLRTNPSSETSSLRTESSRKVTHFSRSGGKISSPERRIGQEADRAEARGIPSSGPKIKSYAPKESMSSFSRENRAPSRKSISPPEINPKGNRERNPVKNYQSQGSVSSRFNESSTQRYIRPSTGYIKSREREPNPSFSRSEIKYSSSRSAPSSRNSSWSREPQRSSSSFSSGERSFQPRNVSSPRQSKFSAPSQSVSRRSSPSSSPARNSSRSSASGNVVKKNK